MSKRIEQVEDGHPATGSYKVPVVVEDTDAPEVTSLEDFLSAKPIPSEWAVINGRRCYFEGMSPHEKDALIKKHSHDDGMGNVTVDQVMWRTDAIAMTWKTGPGGTRILNSEANAQKFFNAPGMATVEAEMYEVASRVAGLGNPEARRKNSENGGGSSISPTSPSISSTLYPESSSRS